MALKKGIMTGKKVESKGYDIAANTDTDELEKVCILLSVANRKYINEYIYETQLKTGKKLSASSILRAALKAFQALSTEKQKEILT